MDISISDVVDGALVNAIAVAGRWLSAALTGLADQGRGDDLPIARWFETFRLTAKVPDLPDVTPGLARQLMGSLRAERSPSSAA